MVGSVARDGDTALAGVVEGDITVGAVTRYFLLGLSLVLLSDVSTRMGALFHAAQGLVLLLIASTFVMPVGRAAMLLFLLAVAGQDIVSSADAGEAYATASIWQLRIGPVRPSWLMFACLFFQLFRLGQFTVPPFIRGAALWFATVPVLTGIAYGGMLGEHASEEVVKDLRFAAMLLGSIVLFVTVLRREGGLLVRLMAGFVGVLLARHLADLVYFMMGLGPTLTQGVSRGSEDSAKGGVVFLIFLGMLLAWRRRNWVFGTLMTVLSVCLLAAYGTRMLWITCAAGAFVMFATMKVRQSFTLLVSMSLIIAGGTLLLFKLNPSSGQVVVARFLMITNGRAENKFAVEADYNVISRIDPIRYGELLNVLDGAAKRFTYLWGTGYGGYYHDDIVNFPGDLESSFPQYSLDHNIFYTAHGYSVHIFLKHGLIGLFVISGLWVFPGTSLYRMFKRRRMFAPGQPTLLHCAMYAMLPFLVTAIYQLYWSGKGLFINGALIAACVQFASRHREDISIPVAPIETAS